MTRRLMLTLVPRPRAAGQIHSARRRVAFLSAALPLVATVLVAVVGIGMAVAQAAPAAGTRVATHIRQASCAYDDLRQLYESAHTGRFWIVRSADSGGSPSRGAPARSTVWVFAAEEPTLFRGTSEGFAGSPGLQAVGVTPATTDPVVGTVFATHAEQFGEGVLHIASPADLAGVKTLPGNVLSGLEREVAVDISPTEFAARAGTTISSTAARSILSDMGYSVPGSIATPAGVQSVLENTGRMSAAEIDEFIARAGG